MLGDKSSHRANESGDSSPPLSPKLRLALQILTRDFGTVDFCLTQLVRELRMSRSHLERLFRTELNTSFRHVLFELRLTLASELLSDPTLSVKEVAARCGCSTLTLIRCFQRKYELTPTQWRRLVVDGPFKHEECRVSASSD